jgi:putative FmdB family regulatory protein
MLWAASSGWSDRPMPTYELHCKECGHRFDRFLMRLIRESDKVCPECGSTQVAQGVGGGYGATSSGSSASACVPRGGFS